MDKKLSWPFGRRAFIFRNWGANHHSEAAAWRVSPSEPRRDAPRDGPARLGAPRALQAPRGPHAHGPWRHPHALWLAVIVAVVVLLQGATYARIHARSSRIQSADEEIARRAEAIRAMLVKQEDLREQVAQLREVVVRMDAAVVDTLERGAAA